MNTVGRINMGSEDWAVSGVEGRSKGGGIVEIPQDAHRLAEVGNRRGLNPGG